MYLRDRRHAGRSHRLFAASNLRAAAVAALIAVSAVAWIKAAIGPQLRPNLEFALAVGPVTLALSLLAGARLGILIAVAMNILGLYFILPPQNSFEFANAGQVFFFSAVLAATAYAAFLFGKRRSRGEDR